MRKQHTRSGDNCCWTILKLGEDILNPNLIATITTWLNGNSNLLTGFSMEIMLEPLVFNVNHYLFLQNKMSEVATYPKWQLTTFVTLAKSPSSIGSSGPLSVLPSLLSRFSSLFSSLPLRFSSLPSRPSNSTESHSVVVPCWGLPSDTLCSRH